MNPSSLLRPLLGVVAAGVFGTAAAVDLSFDFKLNQGPVGTTFATLSLQELVPGTTTFILETELSGGSGNPGIRELRFGCNGCGTPTFVPASSGITISTDGVQQSYDFDFLVEFDPFATSGNTPLIWTATAPPSAFLESTPGSGPNAFALIQLSGGAEVINGENITSGFYIAAVPEPSAYALMLAGLGVVALGWRRRNQRR